MACASPGSLAGAAVLSQSPQPRSLGAPAKLAGAASRARGTSRLSAPHTHREQQPVQQQQRQQQRARRLPPHGPARSTRSIARSAPARSRPLASLPRPPDGEAGSSLPGPSRYSPAPAAAPPRPPRGKATPPGLGSALGTRARAPGRGSAPGMRPRPWTRPHPLDEAPPRTAPGFRAPLSPARRAAKPGLCLGPQAPPTTPRGLQPSAAPRQTRPGVRDRTRAGALRPGSPSLHMHTSLARPHRLWDPQIHPLSPSHPADVTPRRPLSRTFQNGTRSPQRPSYTGHTRSSQRGLLRSPAHSQLHALTRSATVRERLLTLTCVTQLSGADSPHPLKRSFSPLKSHTSTGDAFDTTHTLSCSRSQSRFHTRTDVNPSIGS